MYTYLHIHNTSDKSKVNREIDKLKRLMDERKKTPYAKQHFIRSFIYLLQAKLLKDHDAIVKFINLQNVPVDVGDCELLVEG